MNVNQARKNNDSFKKRARAGEFWSINNKKVKGHIGNISKIKKNGELEAVIITHAKRTFGKKNIRLENNPNSSDKKNAYVVRHKQYAKLNQLGTKHENMKIKNKTDKSIVRKIKSKGKK